MADSIKSAFKDMDVSYICIKNISFLLFNMNLSQNNKTVSKPMVMLKFVDDSGTDITEKVKQAPETPEKTTAADEEALEALEARLKEDFLLPAEETDSEDG